MDDSSVPGIQQQYHMCMYVAAAQKEGVQSEDNKDSNINNQGFLNRLIENDWCLRTEHFIWFNKHYK